MIARAPTLLLHAALLAVAVSPAKAQGGLGSCNDPWGTPAGMTGAARAVHPDILRERFAVAIARRDFATAVAGYVAVVDTTLATFPGRSATFAQLRDSLRVRARTAGTATVAALHAPRVNLAASLADLGVNQFKPGRRALDNEIFFLQRDPGSPQGITIDMAQLSADEVKAICWSAWSLHRLLQNVNFETLPEALVRIEAQERRWERYRSNGPMQLPHELVLNRLRRAWFPPRGENRFNPPVFDLVAVHPFAGIEFARIDNRVMRTESAAIEAGGFTLWVNDWRQLIGVSWVLAYDADGHIGRGPLVRAGGYLTAGLLSRKDETGTSRKSLLISIDALRLLKTDAAPQALRQVQAVAGEILKRDQ